MGTRFSYVNRLYKKYGRLLVIEKLENSNGKKNNGGKWLCKCDCGNKLQLNGYRLHTTKSCGCLIKEGRVTAGIKLRKYEQITINSEYRMYKNSCRCRNLVPLPKANWTKIVFLPCRYCNQIYERNFAKSKRYIKRWSTSLTSEIIKKCGIKMNGIDRLNSSKGYTLKNIFPCCSMCNYMKLDFTEKEFLTQIKLIYKNKIENISNHESQ